ncbi:Solute carrier family 35 member G1 [Holothuria leucospilota]|uniref:Solute carrier family 35 member G1 n=1 Tax=Holothuria leucospilota TaxID=206669 RepID=A0A9Q1CAF7_HOLLE|nr:Solute carrier family 35 member G1 [Holothuria leucospilota]
MFYRCILFLLSVAFVSWDKNEFYHASDMLLYTAYGLLNVGGVLLSYVGLQFAHVGNVTTISTNMPIPAAFLGWLLLGEKITFLDILLFTANMIGLVCVAKPPVIFRQENLDQNRYEFFGALIAFGGLILLVLSTIASRKLAYRNNSDAALQTFFPGMVGLLITGIILSLIEMWALPTSIEEGLMSLLVAILSLLGNVFLVLGLKYERVVVCAVLVTVSVPVSFLAAIVVLHQVPEVVSVIGALLIIGSTFGCLFRPD